MLLRKRMKKMMERRMRRKKRLREEQGSGQLTTTMMMMMTKMTLSLRSRRQTIKSGRPAEHPPNPPLFNMSSAGRQKCGHQVEFSICVHTPNCKFCRTNQDFKALPSYKIL